MTSKANTGRDWLGLMMDWEEGEISPAATVELFQHLINTGEAWTLQGCYGRGAMDLLEAGFCHRPGEVLTAEQAAKVAELSEG